MLTWSSTYTQLQTCGKFISSHSSKILTQKFLAILSFSAATKLLDKDQPQKLSGKAWGRVSVSLYQNLWGCVCEGFFFFFFFFAPFCPCLVYYLYIIHIFMHDNKYVWPIMANPGAWLKKKKKMPKRNNKSLCCCRQVIYRWTYPDPDPEQINHFVLY